MKQIKFRNILLLDKTLIFIVYLLVSISTIFIYSATRSMLYVRNNLIWISIGTLILILSSLIDYKITKKLIVVINAFSLLLLLIVRFAGKKTLGAQRWIAIGPFQLQPSEFIKIAVIITIAYIMVTRFSKGIKSLFDIIKCFIYVLPLVSLILLQPDLGNTLIIIFAYFCMLFLTDANIKPILFIVLFAIISAYPVYRFVLSDYQKTRVEVFINPEKDIKGKGWHVTQSKISIGSGGITGTGVLNGSQSRLKFLPEPQTDFIYSVISEETGFIGSVSIIIIYFWLLYYLLRISRLIEDRYGQIIIYGIVGIFLGHILINIGMTIGYVPVTGKTLLFLSYGGSSYLSAFSMIGLVQSIKIYTEK